MQRELKKLILQLLDEHRIMTIATLRPDGYPQATTVGFVHEGLVLYFVCGSASQKAANIRHDSRVSATIDADQPDVLAIRALSLAGRATEVTNVREIGKAYGLMALRYPEMRSMPAPEPGSVTVFRVEPSVISVLDYSKGFGHTDQVEVDAGDIKASVRSSRHRWHLCPA